jgi:hypothetical protein
VGPRAGLETEAKRKNPRPYWESKRIPPARSLVTILTELPRHLPSGFLTRILYVTHLSQARRMPRSAHPPSFDHPNNIFLNEQVMKLLMMQSSPASLHFPPLRSKYSPQHPVLRYSQPMFFP